MLDITVIIPVYNNEDELKLTFDALDRQTFPKERYEVIIADDGSGHDMKGFVENNTPAGMSVRYFAQPDLGFRPGAARNMGIRNAKGNICLFLDCGLLPGKTCLQSHADTHNKGYDLALGYVYGMNKNPDLNLMKEIIDGNDIETAMVKMKEIGMTDGRDSLYEEHGDDLTTWPAPWVALWSLHFSVSTAFLHKHGVLFDEYFTSWGGEDNEFGINLHRHGARFILSRGAESIHYPPKKTSYQRLQTEPGFKENSIKNREYIVNKYPDDAAVKIWHEKGMFNVNRILLEDAK